jgi:CHASE3 domain sensor protein
MTMWTFGQKIALGFAVSFLLLAGIGAVAYRSVDSLVKTSYLVTQTTDIIDHVGAVLSAMKDAETGQRGFVITGDDSFLDPYRSGIAAAPKILAELRALTSDDPNQQRKSFRPEKGRNTWTTSGASSARSNRRSARSYAGEPKRSKPPSRRHEPRFLGAPSLPSSS